MDEDAYTRTLFDPERMAPGVRGRRWFFCANIAQSMPASKLILSCSYCGRFFANDCSHIPSDDQDFDCYRFPVVYTDGACRNNGQRDAVRQAGLGVAMGTSERDQWAIPVDDSVDPRGSRTSQRAELLAAIRGVEFWTRNWRSTNATGHGQNHVKGPELIVATDSEYVCKGMYEWYPKWRSNGWRVVNGPPQNLDLFHRLNEVVTELEDLGIQVGFLHLKRKYNTLADSLAKKAAAEAQAPLEVTLRMGAMRIGD